MLPEMNEGNRTASLGPLLSRCSSSLLTGTGGSAARASSSPLPDSRGPPAGFSVCERSGRAVAPPAPRALPLPGAPQSPARAAACSSSPPRTPRERASWQLRVLRSPLDRSAFQEATSNADGEPAGYKMENYPPSGSGTPWLEQLISLAAPEESLQIQLSRTAQSGANPPEKPQQGRRLRGP